MPQSFTKDPDAVLNYSIDWETWLSSDTISTSSWTVDTGITKDSDSNTTTATSVVVSAGTAGTTYELTNSVVTAAGYEDDRTIRINVQER